MPRRAFPISFRGQKTTVPRVRLQRSKHILTYDGDKSKVRRLFVDVFSSLDYSYISPLARALTPQPHHTHNTSA